MPTIHRTTRPAVSPKEFRPRHLIEAGVAAAVLGLSLLAFAFPSRLMGQHKGTFVSPDPMYVRMMFRYYVVMIGSWLAAFSITPALNIVAERVRPHWRKAYTAVALSISCAAMSAFLIAAGRRQFGGWDFNILIDVGWRQLQGQHPYVDFITPTPPGFNLGMKLAYNLFGVTWNANLYLSACFTCVSFLWLYWLLVRLGVGRLAATMMAIAIECAVMLDVCFWWYNSTALMLATAFFLSCLLFDRKPRTWQVQLSYSASLALLILMKPNIAGATLMSGIFLLLLVTDARLRLLLLTSSAFAVSVFLLLVNDVPIGAMLASYRGVSVERGLSAFAFGEMNHFAEATALWWVAVVSVPLLSLLPSVARHIEQKDWRELARLAFFPMTVVIALYGIATNGDFRQMECALLLAAGAVITFGMRLTGPALSRTYIAIVLAGSVSDLYLGAMRARVYTIGPHRFFEWSDNQQRMQDGFLKDMRVSSVLVNLQKEVALAINENPGPYFLGPRIDFNYAVLGLISPQHFATWWQPGTAFGKRETMHLLEVWRDHRFQTLVFLQGDYTFYPQAFLDLIAKNYVRDDSYPGLTVYHAHKGE